MTSVPLRYLPKYLATYQRLKRNLNLSASELKRLQLKKLKAAVKSAYTEIPLYSKLLRSNKIKPDDINTIADIRKLPIITKTQLQKAGPQAIAPHQYKKVIVERTSGSTGLPITLHFEIGDWLHRGASYERVRTENGFRLLFDVLLMIAGPRTSNVGLARWLQYLGIWNRRHINVCEELNIQINSARALLLKSKVDALWGYPSSIRILGSEINRRALAEIYPKMVFTASEVLSPKARHHIKKLYNTEVFDVYGAVETGCIAWECQEHDGHHICMDMAIVELLDEDHNPVSPGESGKVIITSLHSQMMPIIRYELGDVAVRRSDECSCGIEGEMMGSIEGRSDDFIKLSYNRRIPPLAMDHLVMSVGGMQSFRIIQEDLRNITVLVVPDRTIDQTKIAFRISKRIHHFLGNEIEVETKFVPSIPKDKSGKLRSVVSRINRAQ